MKAKRISAVVLAAILAASSAIPMYASTEQTPVAQEQSKETQDLQEAVNEAEPQVQDKSEDAEAESEETQTDEVFDAQTQDSVENAENPGETGVQITGEEEAAEKDTVSDIESVEPGDAEGAEGENDSAANEMETGVQTEEGTETEENVDTEDQDAENPDSEMVTEEAETAEPNGEPEATEDTLAEDRTVENEFEIPDKIVEEAIREELGLSDDEPITKEEMLNITWLSLRGDGASDMNLEGLQYAKNLWRLSVSQVHSVNLESLAELENLTYLYLDDNKIDDISALAGLTNLTSLSASNNYISDIEPLKNLNQLSYLNLSGNQIKDISAITEMTGLSSVDLKRNLIQDITPCFDLQPKQVVNFQMEGNEIVVDDSLKEQYFDKCYSEEIDQVDVIINDSTYTCEIGCYKKFDIFKDIITPEAYVEDESVAAVESLSVLSDGYVNSGWIQVRISWEKPGATDLYVTVGDISKKIHLIVATAEGNVPEEDTTNILPSIADYDPNHCLYQGNIWNISGEDKINISTGVKIKNYVSRQVYFSDFAHKQNEIAAVDDGGVLYYWKVDSSGNYQEPVKIADNVQGVYKSGYLDSSNTFHYWKYSYSDGENAVEEIQSIDNVKEAYDDYLILNDGTSILNGMAPGNIGQLCLYHVDTEIRAYDSSDTWSYIDGNNILWSKLQAGQNEWRKVQEDVVETASGSYLSPDKILYRNGNEDKDVIDTDVDELYSNGMYRKGTDVYDYERVYDADSEQYVFTNVLVATDVKKVVRNLILKNDGEVWVTSWSGSPYLYFTSAKDLVVTYYSAYTEEVSYAAVRADGSIWKLQPPLTPYATFIPESTPETTLWSDTDETTGISASAENIGENIVLSTQLITENTSEYAEAYQSISDYVAQQKGKQFTVYDIKLLDSDGNEVQPEAGNPVTVKVPMAENYSSNLKVYHRGDDGAINELPSATEENSVIFQTDGFSLFVISDLGESAENPEDPGTEDPTTPEDPGTEDPSTPEDPGTEEPTTPEDPGTEEPTTPEDPDTEEPNTPEDPANPSEPEQPTPAPTEPANQDKPGTNTSTNQKTDGETENNNLTVTPVENQSQTDTVNTGDPTNIWIYVGAMAAAVLTMGCYFGFRKKHSK